MSKSLIFFTFISISPFVPTIGYSEDPSPKKEFHSIVYGEVDYLLWFANQDDLHYPTVATGDSPNLNPDWSSGVRATIGTHPSFWDTKFCYTYYTTSSQDKAHTSIATIFSSPPSTSGIFEVGAKWTLNFNRFDWELGRTISLKDYFSIRPFFGLEGLYTHQKFNLNTNSIFLDLDTNDPVTDSIDSKNKNSFLSMGPRAGFNALFQLGAGFEFYGNFSGSILLGRFKIKQTYDQTDFYPSESPITLIDQTKQISQSASIFNCDLGIGFNWRHYFQNPKLEFLLKLEWEQHYYTDIIRFQNFYLQQSSLGTAAYSSNGNLSLSGFSFGASLGY